jgi:hypothetical protein
LVAALLIVRKLHRHKYWGGDEIAKGRGVSPEFKDIAQEIATFLYQKGILIVKYEGRGRRRRSTA